MYSYETLDYLPDLTETERLSATTLSFSPYSTSYLDWDYEASAYGTNQYAILHSIYKFTATEGATYDIFSTSYFDPFLLT